MTGRSMVLAATLVAAAVFHATAAAQEAGAVPNEVYFGAFYKPVCDRIVAGFAATTATAYPVWERRNHAGVAALESNPQFQAKRREALVAPPAELAAAKSHELSVTCERVGNLFEAALPQDARFNSPAQTWETFRKGLREGNRDLIRACLMGEARKALEAPLTAMTNEQLRRMGESVAELRLTAADRAYQEAVVVQKNGALGRVSFIKNGANWKIAQM